MVPDWNDQRGQAVQDVRVHPRPGEPHDNPVLQRLWSLRRQQWDCYNGTPERWRFEYVGNVSGEYYYRVRNVNSGKCLEVRDGYTDNGGIIEQYDCWDGPMQLWTPRTAPATDHVWLVNRNSGKCLDDTDWSPWAGTSLQQVDCGPYTAQYWRLYPV
jgi:hypothetical protein